jgi:hypothetical protein
VQGQTPGPVIYTTVATSSQAVDHVERHGSPCSSQARTRSGKGEHYMTLVTVSVSGVRVPDLVPDMMPCTGTTKCHPRRSTFKYAPRLQSGLRRSGTTIAQLSSVRHQPSRVLSYFGCDLPSRGNRITPGPYSNKWVSFRLPLWVSGCLGGCIPCAVPGRCGNMPYNILYPRQATCLTCLNVSIYSAV